MEDLLLPFAVFDSRGRVVGKFANAAQAAKLVMEHRSVTGLRIRHEGRVVAGPSAPNVRRWAAKALVAAPRRPRPRGDAR